MCGLSMPAGGADRGDSAMGGVCDGRYPARMDSPGLRGLFFLYDRSEDGLISPGLTKTPTRFTL